MNEAFEAAFSFVTRDDIEGGYINDPHDPGGETKYGISRRAYPSLIISTLTLADAKAIYWRDYWKPAQCTQMPLGIAIAVFDCAVNQGIGRARRLLQRAASVRIDGRIGPITLAAIHSANETSLIAEFLSYRLRHYATTKNANRYMRGWSMRILALHALLLVAHT